MPGEIEPSEPLAIADITTKLDASLTRRDVAALGVARLEASMRAKGKELDKEVAKIKQQIEDLYPKLIESKEADEAEVAVIEMAARLKRDKPSFIRKNSTSKEGTATVNLLVKINGKPDISFCIDNLAPNDPSLLGQIDKLSQDIEILKGRMVTLRKNLADIPALHRHVESKIIESQLLKSGDSGVELLKALDKSIPSDIESLMEKF